MAEKISMSFPADTEYISTIRLAISGIAGKLEFAIDEIEDLKSCVSEACLLILCGQKCDGLDVQVDVGTAIQLQVTGLGAAAGDCDSCTSEFNEEISKIMLEALSENVQIDETDGLITSISFEKKRLA